MLHNRILFFTGKKFAGASADIDQPNDDHVVDFRNVPKYKIIPYYIDLNVGQKIRVVKNDGSEIDIRIIDIKAESRRYFRPRVRVRLEIGGLIHFAYCGMVNSRQGGIGPIRVSDVNIGVEITKLVFSKICKSKTSPFNTYENFKLTKDLRLAIWDGKKPIMKNAGLFIVNQPVWTRNKFGNWLHRTNYGFHSAIDIFATRHGEPEEVFSPVDGVVYRVYNKGGDVDSKTRSKAINIYSDDEVGPKGEKVLFRFQHFSKITVSSGDQVKKGQVIGLTGHTGFNAGIGDHLHFEIRLNPSYFGQEADDNIFSTIPVNPYYYLMEWWENRVENK
ncbi:MAG: M23 family metallopeptidase [Deltaproteobacteria bacterium]|nr:M23 family metallopeptidase [Deltaproteobacteria bacterium]